MNDILRKKKFKELLSTGQLYGITSKNYFSNNFEAVKNMLNGGIKIIQYREKSLPFQDMIKEVNKILTIIKDQNAYLIINDYVELCKETDANGVHLGQDDMKIDNARKVLGENKIIGLSTHNIKQGEESLSTSADYIGLGPVFKSDTKPDKTPIGLEYLKYASKNFMIPKVAIGGINQKNLNLVLKSGINSVCIIEGLFKGDNLKQTVSEIQKQLAKNR